MKKEDVLSVMLEVGVEPNDVNYEYTDRLLRKFSMEVVMNMVGIGNRYTFLGEKWHVADECMSAVPTSIPDDLVKRNESFYWAIKRSELWKMYLKWLKIKLLIQYKV